MADTVLQLEQKIKAALDHQSDVLVNPAAARAQIAQELAQAFAAFTQGRIVTGQTTDGAIIVNAIVT